MEASAPLAASFRAVAAGLAALAGFVALRARETGRVLQLRFVAVTAHWVQALVHVALYVVWARAFEEVGAHAPHIAAQVLFYYAFELLVAFLRRDEARTGFGPLPIVGSVNLFLWFRDDLFVLQFALLAVGVLAKELVLWERDGRRVHVFNPSSFPLFLVCAVLWASGGDFRTWAGDIAVTQGLVPHAWLIVFGLGLVVQALFATTLVTLASVATLYGLNLLYTAVTGVYCWVDVGIPAAIFLGCNFLVTDPATSPRTARGRAVFGALYGLAVFGMYLWLREVGGPAYYDKLLCVPFLNLLVRRLDRLGGGGATGRGNLAWLAVGIAGFAFLYGTRFLGPEHPGKDVAFWQAACEADRWHACRSWSELLDARCREGEWQRCEELALLLEEGGLLERDRATAGYHLALACQEGVASACDRAGGFLSSGGAQALSEACDADDAVSCLVLGTLQLEHERAGLSPERRKAIHAPIERACDLGLPEACSFLERPVPSNPCNPAPDSR